MNTPIEHIIPGLKKMGLGKDIVKSVIKELSGDDSAVDKHWNAELSDAEFESFLLKFSEGIVDEFIQIGGSFLRDDKGGLHLINLSGEDGTC
jgi:hypothetical protein